MDVISKGKSGHVIVPGMVAVFLLTACAGGNGGNFDWDLRNNDSATSGAVQAVTGKKPVPDENGVISYPGYQVIVARRGDTVASLAARVGLTAEKLAGFNALKPGDSLREGEVLALPVRVAGATQPVAAPTAGLDVTSIATSALDRVDTQALPVASGASAKPATGKLGAGKAGADKSGAVPFSAQSSGPVPVRYQVKRGETAFTIARNFGISAKALADWNGLGADLAVREGQYLIIPTAQDASRVGVVAQPDTTLPGQGSPLPEPPSARTPLPDEPTQTAAQVEASKPEGPDMATQRTASSAARFAMPVDGKIVRGYQKKVNDGIDIAAAAGSAVKAAAEGTVAAVTQDPSGALIIVVKHSGGLLTVYTGIEAAAVAQGATVTRGQTIARVGGDKTLHFEVRQGLDSVDPVPYL